MEKSYSSILIFDISTILYKISITYPTNLFISVVYFPKI